MRIALAVLLAAGTGAATGLTVHTRQQPLKAAPNAWSATLANVVEGCTVVEQEVKGAWAKVQARCTSPVALDKVGYLPRAAYMRADLTGVSGAGAVSATDSRIVSKAARGFSKEVEEKRVGKPGNADLAPAYKTIDGYLAGADAARAGLTAFASRGQLVPEVTP